MRDTRFETDIPSIIMSKPPTVSDFASTMSAVLAPVSKQLPEAIDRPVIIRPDFDSDVLWKPPRLSRSRTESTESNDSYSRRSASVCETSPPVDLQPRTRRFSFTEMFFGSSHRMQSPQNPPTIAEANDVQNENERKRSVPSKMILG